ncbi:MAG: hypothetical protein LLG00_12095 [Planctomycetaceae bacterium]|nr:hypothetical protein [Planctomycetaceae bacterium]
MSKKCPRGHWYEPDASRPGSGCPVCAGQTKEGPPISDDDVLAIMGEPEPSPGSSSKDEPAKSLSGSGIMRRKKVCPECSHEASFSFVYCPRCGAPLKLASIDFR